MLVGIVAENLFSGGKFFLLLTTWVSHFEACAHFPERSLDHLSI